MDNLKSYTGVVGIDVSEAAIEAARQAVDAENTSFLVMDAADLDFDGESFDTVSISVSLHHMTSIQGVLEEMKRVLKSGGRFIVSEMYRDARTEPEVTSISLHQWAAEIDTALGHVHNNVMTRREILDRFATLDLRDVERHDCTDDDSDPMDPETKEHIEGVIEQVSKRAAESERHEEFAERAEELLRRLHEVGAVGQPRLLLIGEK